jgi:peptidoglycan/LPS O-acetylase OafA/YrhL
MEGHTGVTLFFVLSGFLITYRYEEPLSASPWFHRREEISQYFINRIARIWPVYLLIASATLLVQGREAYVWLLNLTLFKGFSDRWVFSGVPQSWSLTVEETFYLLAPLLFILGRKLERRLSIQASLGILVLICWGAGLALWKLAGISGAGIFENISFVILFTFFGRCFEFFCGYYMAKTASLSPKKSTGSTYLFISLFIILLVALSRLQSPYPFGLYHPLGMAINNLVLPVVIAALLVALCRESTLPSKWLSHPLFQLLGAASYCFYLIHMGPLRDALLREPMFHFLRRSWLLAFVLTNLLALGLFQWVEKPLRAQIKKRLLPV